MFIYKNVLQDSVSTSKNYLETKFLYSDFMPTYESIEVCVDKGITSVPVIETINYIEENYEDGDLSLKQIASNFDYSYTNLSRIFKVQTGYSFKEYLGKLRVEKAIVLLKTTNHKIYEVAEMVGLSTKNFNRLFIKYIGESPKHLRN